MVVGLWHWTEDPLVPWEPSESLLITHCVHLWVLLFHVRTVQLLTSFIFVVVNMQCVNYLLNVQPPQEVVEAFWPPSNCWSGTCYHMTRWSFFFLDSWVILANAESIHTSTIRNTCAGPSDLDTDNDIRTHDIKPYFSTQSPKNFSSTGPTQAPPMQVAYW